jgi:hypothetical protein
LGEQAVAQTRGSMGLHPSPAFVSPLTDSPNQEILFEFRAGKMMTNGTRVTPDPRKGLVRLSKSEDTLTHFQWWDRTLNLMEDVSWFSDWSLLLVVWPVCFRFCCGSMFYGVSLLGL